VVQAGLDASSPWQPFVENWAGDEFAAYVSYLEGELNALAEGTGPAERARMAELFERTTKYEIAFWEMAMTGGGWPGTTTAPVRPAGEAG
jgi:thiaminase/transcriptional activator TenA